MQTLVREWFTSGLDGNREGAFRFIDALSQKPSQFCPEGDINPILQHSWEVWNKVHKMFGLSQNKQGYLSIWENPAIKIGKKTVCWRAWHLKGIATIADLIEDEVFYSYQAKGLI